MAKNPFPRLIFREGCPDCGSREVRLPEPPPPVGDDFDWLLRDYDGFRLFMMEELAEAVVKPLYHTRCVMKNVG